MLKIKLKKIASTICVSSLIFVEMFPLTAGALFIPNSTIKSGINQGNAQANQILSGAQSSDIGGVSNKESDPSVQVSFTETSSSGGAKKMVATAIPGFFNNSSDPKKLYFTWYLKRGNCNLKNSGVDKNDTCNLDGDDKITVNDWKIAATRIIVKNASNASLSNSSAVSNTDSAGFLALPEIDKKNNNENIGWRNGFLRDHNGNTYKENGSADGIRECYAQEPKSGLTYELTRVSPDYSGCSDDADGNKYHLECVSMKKENCPVNLSKQLTVSNSIDAAKKINEQKKIIRDQIATIIAQNNVCTPRPACIQPVPNDPGADVAIPAPFPQALTVQESKNFCSVNIGSTECNIKDDSALKDFKTTVSCKNSDEVPMCVRSQVNPKTGEIVTQPDGTAKAEDMFFPDKTAPSAAILTKEGVCSSVVDNSYYTDSVVASIISNPNTLDLVNHPAGILDPLFDPMESKTCQQTKDLFVNSVLGGNVNLEPTCGFRKDVNLCKHLFPSFTNKKVLVDGKEINLNSDDVTGDGKLTPNEKTFWGVGSGDSNVNSYEEKVVGLGVDKFEWSYSPGDMVGVVVEGDSVFSSKHKDSSFKRMWAFSKGTCSALEDLGNAKLVSEGEKNNENKRGFYSEGGTGFLTAEVDLNDCLEENLLDPKNDSGFSALSLNFTKSPDNPINDPGGNGDTLKIGATALNTTNQDGLAYTWTVQKSRDASDAPNESTRWVDITQDALNSGSFSSSDLKGLNKKDLNMDLNFPESEIVKKGNLPGKNYNGVFYLRILAEAKGSGADNGMIAKGFIDVRVIQQRNEMHVFSVTAANDGSLGISKDSSGKAVELCTDAQEKSACYVSENDILGFEVKSPDNEQLKISAWTVNDNNIVCGKSCSDGDNKMFVPVIGKQGESISVEAKGTNKKGEIITVSKYFIIGSKQLSIMSSDSNALPKLLGYYKGVDSPANCSSEPSACRPDFSTHVFETKEKATVTFSVGGQSGFEWYIDGQNMSEFSNKNKISFTVGKAMGDTYDIQVMRTPLPGGDTQLKNIRKALFNNWGISPDEEITPNESADIQLNVVGGAQAVASSGTGFFGASLITHLPEELMFLLKISLTTLLLFFLTGALFALIPERLFQEENE